MGRKSWYRSACGFPNPIQKPIVPWISYSACALNGGFMLPQNKKRNTIGK